MRNVVLTAGLIILLSACRPSVDRADSSEALAEAGATEQASGPTGRNPIARDAEKATPETLPDNVATTSPQPANESGPASPGNTASTNAGATQPAPIIPAQYGGRWGMVPADCTSTRGDAKGLIRIGERTIRFYESTATLLEQRVAATISFSGLYAFAGEGQTWERVVTLTRDGDRLTRADEEGTYTYTRCR